MLPKIFILQIPEHGAKRDYAERVYDYYEPIQTQMAVVRAASEADARNLLAERFNEPFWRDPMASDCDDADDLRAGPADVLAYGAGTG